jgi:hypothetical protein
VGLVGGDEHVEQREGTAAHGADVRDVRHDGGGPGRMRIGRDERGQDRLAAEHDPLLAVCHERAVVALPDGPQAPDEPQVALGVQRARVADGRGERDGVGGVGVRHRRRIQPGPSAEGRMTLDLDVLGRVAA